MNTHNKNMKYLKQIATVLFGILLAGCNNEKEGWTEEPSEELKFTSGVSFVEETKPMSRAAFDKTQNGGLKLILRDVRGAADQKFTGDVVSNGAIGEAVSGVNAITCTPVLYWNDLGGKDASFTIIGIHPSSFDTWPGDKITYKLPDNQSGGLKPHELMFAKVEDYNYANKGNGVQLDFSHSLAKISVTLKPTPTFPLEELEKITAADVSFQDVPLKAEYTITDGTYEYPTAASAVTPVRAEVKDDVDETKAFSFSILAVPHSISAGAVIATVKLGGNTYYVKADKAYTFIKGEHTNFNVTISKTAVTATATIVDWTKAIDVNDLQSRLVDLGTFTVNTKEGSKVTLAEGAKVFMNLTDKKKESETKGTTRLAVFGRDAAGDWNPTQAVYWDDINEAITDVEGLLITQPVTNYAINSNGEYYFTGSVSGKDFKWTSSSTIDLDKANSDKPFFTRPLSKVSITIITSNEADPDKVDLGNISKVIIPGKVNFTVSENSTLVGQSETANLTINGSYNSTEKQYKCATAYIYPQTDQEELCHVTIGSNTYKVALPEENQEFIAGNHYTFTVKITKTNVGFTASLTDWVEVPGGELPGEL